MFKSMYVVTSGFTYFGNISTDMMFNTNTLNIKQKSSLSVASMM